MSNDMKDKDKTKGQLISELDEMRQQVALLEIPEAARKRTEEALRESEKRYGIIYETSGDAVMTLEPPEWKFSSGNNKIVEMFGVKDEREFISLTPWQISPEYQPDGQLSSTKAKKMIDVAMKEGENFFEWTHKRMGGTDFYATVLLSRVEFKGKAFLQARVDDITDRKRAEEELVKHREHLEELVDERTEKLVEQAKGAEQLNKALLNLMEDHELAKQKLEHAQQQVTAANKELKAFSYSVSHDLRAPLRSMAGFSQALLEDCGDQLDEHGKDYLGRVRKASQRMAALIEDILKLSRVTQTEMNHEKLNLSRIAETVASDQRESHRTRNVEFRIEPEMNAEGDSRLLHVVMDNLLGNAVKFTGRRRDAKIEVGSTRTNGAQVFYVKDNGAGFDMQYADKLFGAFQRFHSPEQFEGTGIGLATVQRIIHRHGGNIWAEAEEGKGATFYFTLG